jgi:hypothetical protein
MERTEKAVMKKSRLFCVRWSRIRADRHASGAKNESNNNKIHISSS